GNKYNGEHEDGGEYGYDNKNEHKYNNRDRHSNMNDSIDEKLKNGNIWQRTIVCKHYSWSQKTKCKNQNKYVSKCIGCIWQINISCPEKENSHKYVYIIKIIDKHENYELNLSYLSFQESLDFPKNILKDIEFYIKKMDCSPQQIRVAKKKEENLCWYVAVDWDP
ncbi:19440_t:CDS:2, partial [Racocetra persica]